jgi:hypothetical protein
VQNVAHRTRYNEHSLALMAIDMMAGTQKSCHVCGQIATSRCPFCTTRLYCSRDCQIKDWKVDAGNHKNHCPRDVESKPANSVSIAKKALDSRLKVQLNEVPIKQRSRKKEATPTGTAVGNVDANAQASQSPQSASDARPKEQLNEIPIKQRSRNKETALTSPVVGNLDANAQASQSSQSAAPQLQGTSNNAPPAPDASVQHAPKRPGSHKAKPRQEPVREKLVAIKQKPAAHQRTNVHSPAFVSGLHYAANNQPRLPQESQSVIFAPSPHQTQPVLPRSGSPMHWNSMQQQQPVQNPHAPIIPRSHVAMGNVAPQRERSNSQSSASGGQIGRGPARPNISWHQMPPAHVRPMVCRSLMFCAITRIGTQPWLFHLSLRPASACLKLFAKCRLSPRPFVFFQPL